MNIITRVAAIAAVAAGIAVSGCNVFRGESTAGQYVDDVTITSKVKANLLDDERVDGHDDNVDSTNGVVKLSGWASTTAEVRTASEIARSVDGVRSVNNDLQVKK